MWHIRALRTILVAVFTVVLVIGVPALATHPGFSASALVKIDSKGVFTLRLRHDALAFALDESPANIADAPMLEFLDASRASQEEAFLAGRDRFATLFVLTADGRRINIEILESPTVTALAESRLANGNRRLPVKLDFVARATLPPGSHAFSFNFPKVLGDVIVTIDRPVDEPMAFPLRPGETTSLFAWASPVGEANPGEPNTSENAINAPVREMSATEVAGRYVWLGFTHIIPEGTDHALFVLGLFLLSPRVKSLLWQITAFTLAHSVTLTLTTLHLVTLPSIIIEPTIAASIAFIAVENLTTKKVRAWRPMVAFLFGLVHGMGFASALGEIGLPTGQLVAGLLAFNVGVECGHLTVLTTAFLLLGWCRNKPWYRTRVVIPLSLAIASFAVLLIVQRVLAG